MLSTSFIKSAKQYLVQPTSGSDSEIHLLSAINAAYLAMLHAIAETLTETLHPNHANTPVHHTLHQSPRHWHLQPPDPNLTEIFNKDVVDFITVFVDLKAKRDATIHDPFFAVSEDQAAQDVALAET